MQKKSPARSQCRDRGHCFTEELKGVTLSPVCLTERCHRANPNQTSSPNPALQGGNWEGRERAPWPFSYLPKMSSQSLEEGTAACPSPGISLPDTLPLPKEQRKLVSQLLLTLPEQILVIFSEKFRSCL